MHAIVVRLAVSLAQQQAATLIDRLSLLDNCRKQVCHSARGPAGDQLASNRLSERREVRQQLPDDMAH